MEEIKNVFQKEYSENKLTDFLIKTQKVYEIFGYDFILKPKEVVLKNFYGGKVWLNEEYINSPISNLDIITFKLVYPNLITKIVETNLVGFREVYSKLIDLYQLDKNIQLKKYINMVYGCLQNPDCMIYSNNIHLVPIKLNKMLSDILSEFKGHIVYVDTDQIFFRNFDEIRERFEKYLTKINKHDLTYFSEKSKFGLFFSKKRYIFEENGNIKIKGMKHFTKYGIERGGLIKLNSELIDLY